MQLWQSMTLTLWSDNYSVKPGMSGPSKIEATRYILSSFYPCYSNAFYIQSNMHSFDGLYWAYSNSMRPLYDVGKMQMEP